jgi:hypothetical protein
VRTLTTGSFEKVTIDAALIDGETGAAVLVLVQAEPWGPDGNRLEELQDRVSECATFALDGQMARRFPTTEGRRVVVSIEYVHEPGAMERRFFEIVRAQLEEHDIELRLVSLS